VGHDQISQTIYLPEAGAGGSWDEGETNMFGTDGHGSVRVLYDLAGVIARDDQQRMQVYFYDAYGNLLALGGSSLTSSTLPLTTYLYSGEAFDFRIGQQYLRARWYDARTGRFDRLDPFAGNSQDPQSFHKYGYVHGDPIQGIDPSGMFFGVAGLAIGLGGAYAGRKYDFNAMITGGNLMFLFTTFGIAPAMGIAFANSYYNSLTEPIFVGNRPDFDSNSPRHLWQKNIEDTLIARARANGGTQADEIAAREIARRYVDLVSDRGHRFHGLQGSNAQMFGYGGNYGWLENWYSGKRTGDQKDQCKCYAWADAIHREIVGLTHGTHWKVTRYVDATKSYDPFASLFGWLTHNFVTIDFAKNENELAAIPDFVLDPWATGRPDIYEGSTFNRAWPFASATDRL
jgi:RHS repeat-associated protein